jgi:hypothetical protein
MGFTLALEMIESWIQMFVAETIARIRRAHFVQGKSITAICRERRVSGLLLVRWTSRFACLDQSFEFHRTEIAHGRVTPPRVVEALDVVEHIGARLVAGALYAAPEPLDLVQPAAEPCRQQVVPDAPGAIDAVAGQKAGPHLQSHCLLCQSMVAGRRFSQA